MKVRNLRSDEMIPPTIKSGFEGARLSPEFVWVAEHENKIVAALFVSAAHQIVFLHRLVAAPNAPKSAVLILLRGAAHDFLERDYLAFITGPMDSSRPAERKLLRLALGSIGAIFKPKQRMVGGPIRFFLERRMRRAA